MQLLRNAQDVRDGICYEAVSHRNIKCAHFRHHRHELRILKHTDVSEKGSNRAIAIPKITECGGNIYLALLERKKVRENFR